MFSQKKTTAQRQNMVLYLPVRAIRPNPQQPRRQFDKEELCQLSDSISLYGILQPLTVRKQDAGWELVAGERRLRAAKIAGLQEVPCLVVETDDEGSGMLSLIENIQRKDLNYIEQAQSIARLMRQYGLSQEQIAGRLGKSQSAIANKLRLLKHPPELLEFLRQSGLSERHARALLLEPDGVKRMQLAQKAAQEHWSVAKLEQVLESNEPVRPRFLWKNVLLKEARLLLNSLEHSLQSARAAGLKAYGKREETEKEIVLTIHLPKVMA